MSEDLETWYRGEGVGVPPAKAGGHEHDFGDGMYLSDRSDVAGVYADRRATSPDGRRVFVVNLGRASLGRVLDLSADARWQNFMNDRTEPAFGKQSRLDSVKLKHELYGQFFNEFLRRFKIDLKTYDAVVGPEYNLGGRQLCILHKNGQPTKLAARVRTLFRLVTPTAVKVPVAADQEAGPVPLPKGPATSRFRAGLRNVVSAAGAVAVQALLEYAVALLWEWIDKKTLEKELVKLQPTIDARLAPYTQKALALLSVARPAYANIVLKIEIISSPQLGVSRTPLIATLTDVYVSHVKFEGTGKESKEYVPFAGNIASSPLFLSPPMTFPRDRIELFKSAIAELQWYEETLKNPVLHKSDSERLSKEKQERHEWMIETFGPFPGAPVGNEKGYRGGYQIQNWFDDE
jgi:hypothetical protein